MFCLVPGNLSTKKLFHECKEANSGLNKSVKRNKFSDIEDEILRKSVSLYGTSDWSIIASKLPGRTTRQCRDRWNHYLSVDTIKIKWTPAEDALLLDLYSEFGNHWSKIAEFFPGRNGINIRNRCLYQQKQAETQLISELLPKRLKQKSKEKESPQIRKEQFPSIEFFPFPTTKLEIPFLMC